MILSCLDVQKSFGSRRVLSGVSFETPETGIVLLTGENGAGKSVLLDILTGFQRADRGKVTIGGRDVGGRCADQIARWGVRRTFQRDLFPSALCALDVVLLSCDSWRNERLMRSLLSMNRGMEPYVAMARSALAMTHLQLDEAKPADALSVGQKRLLGLACCLVGSPGLVFLDEPLAGLHPSMIEHAIALIRKIAGSALVFIVEHQLNGIDNEASLILRLEGGRLIEGGLLDPGGR